jgi:hypothetical protein
MQMNAELICNHYELSNCRNSQESKGSGTLSGSKAETNDDAASTSRSKSIQPNNLDLAFDKSNVDDQQKLFLLKNKWDIPSSFVFPLLGSSIDSFCRLEKNCDNLLCPGPLLCSPMNYFSSYYKS